MELFFNISKLILFIISYINNKFRSRRRGFQRYIVGQLKECASRFYNEDICVRIQDDISTNECNLVEIFSVEKKMQDLFFC
jgi:hypothetical protein